MFALFAHNPTAAFWVLVSGVAVSSLFIGLLVGSRVSYKRIADNRTAEAQQTIEHLETDLGAMLNDNEDLAIKCKTRDVQISAARVMLDKALGLLAPSERR